ncbi:hypothetical protein SAMN02745225_00556 [Ferrithrix thermotolerans DSM 19514]|jgi:hypothetical protein|uniref:Uncharacterized protein n=1 Tax=Ferrithrix thermotolerans DSM 19514 TaxID=1121881 RepID=A0A1M4T8R0_9ACTN|nr:hypothetical protein [Ferrithrix thermotolerans]SHE40942.1 hypothetical protein SAMN02745225_00556 [Ferrithrix thermotolerans DSM 19514]
MSQAYFYAVKLDDDRKVESLARSAVGSTAVEVLIDGAWVLKPNLFRVTPRLHEKEGNMTCSDKGYLPITVDRALEIQRKLAPNLVEEQHDSMVA